MRIGIFDSGVGGLTVLKEYLKLMPENDYIYFGDTKRVPYGNKSKEAIETFTRGILDYLATQDVDLIVAACNTVSAVCLDDFKYDYLTTIEGVIKPVIEKISLSSFRKVGVIGTTATIDSEIYPRLIKHAQFLSKIEVISKACPLFVPIVEEGLDINNKIVLDAIKFYLEDLKKAKIEALILACTHYPILEEKIKEYLNGVQIINPAYLSAFDFYKFYKCTDVLKDLASSGSVKLYFSDLNPTVEKISERILQKKLPLEQINIE